MGRRAWWRPRSARVEGLAAGTGLLMGSVATTGEGHREQVTCPACGDDQGVVDLVDLVERRTRYRCDSCRHRWFADVASTGPAL